MRKVFLPGKSHGRSLWIHWLNHLFNKYSLRPSSCVRFYVGLWHCRDERHSPVEWKDAHLTPSPSAEPHCKHAGLGRLHWGIRVENQLDRHWAQAQPLFHSTQQLLSSAQQPAGIDLWKWTHPHAMWPQLAGSIDAKDLFNSSASIHLPCQPSTYSHI